MDETQFEKAGTTVFGVFVRRKDGKIPSLVKLCFDRIFHMEGDAIAFMRDQTEKFGDSYCIYPMLIHVGLTPVHPQKGCRDGEAEEYESTFSD